MRSTIERLTGRTSTPKWNQSESKLPYGTASKTTSVKKFHALGNAGSGCGTDLGRLLLDDHARGAWALHSGHLKKVATIALSKKIVRAGDGNRTRMASLEGWSSTIELHPRVSVETRTSLEHTI